MRSNVPTLPFALAALLIPAVARTQALAPGKWSGSGTDPSGNVKTVSYNVVQSGSALSITLFDPASGDSIPFEDVRQVSDSLLFNWAGGRNKARLVCKLVRQTDGVYEGSCFDTENRQGRMRMIPPEKQ